MKKLTRAIALFFVIALVLASVPAFERGASADTTTVWVSSTKCPVYKTKSTSSKLLGTLYFGETMICENYSSKKTGWARVMNNKGKFGYCKMSCLSKENPSKLSVELRAIKASKVYSEPDAKYKKKGTVKKGTLITVVGVTPDYKWWRALGKKSNVYYFVPVSCFTGTELATFSGQSADILDGKEKVIGTLSYGEQVTLISETKKGWLLYYENGKLGYVASDEFDDSEWDGLDKTAYAAADGVWLYSEAVFKKATAHITVDKNKTVKLIYGSDERGYYRVQYKKKYYYVQAKTVFTEKADTYALYADGAVKLYKNKTFTSKNLAGSLTSGEKVAVRAVYHTKVKVENESGLTGWCMLSSLKKGE